MTSAPFASLAVDANAILSAITAGAASRVFEAELDIAFVTTRANLDEVKRNAPDYGARYHLPRSVVRKNLQRLPLKIYEAPEYISHLAEAARMLRGRKSDDVHLLALALKLDVPMWSNDPHLGGLPRLAYPTAVLLKILGL